MGKRLEAEVRLRSVDTDLGVVGGILAERDARVGEVRDGGKQGVAAGLDLGDHLVQLGDPVADGAGLRLLGLGLLGLLLAHQRADLLGDGVAPGLELLDLGQRGAAALVEGENLGDLGVIAGEAGR